MHNWTKRVLLREILSNLCQIAHNLEELSLSSEECKMFDDKRIGDVHFLNVKVLHILCFHDKSDVFPWGLLPKFIKLETLEVFCCELEYLWACEGNANEEEIGVDAGSGTGTETFPCLRELILQDLPNVKTFSGPKQVLQQLQTLQVFRCGLVKSLAPSSASFPCLKTLSVHYCDRIEFLFTSSTAKSLLQLRELEVKYCENLRQIFVSETETEGVGEAIVLEHLILKGLPNLTRFIYSGEHKIEIHHVHAFSSEHKAVEDVLSKKPSHCLEALKTTPPQKGNAQVVQQSAFKEFLTFNTIAFCFSIAAIFIQFTCSE